jgi:multiple sugar transport system permease protein
VTATTGPAAETAKKGSRPSRGSTRGGSRRATRSDSRLAYYLVTPTIVLLLLVIAYPVVDAIINSMKRDTADTGLNANGIFEKGGEFIGFKYYEQWLNCGPSNGCVNVTGTQQHDTYSALFTTVFYTVVSVALEVVLGILMALVMHRSFKGRGIVRAAILVPWAIPTAVTARMWEYMLKPEGVVNHIFGTHILWTVDTWPARFAVVIADVWKTTPFIALLLLAGLQVIPDELYESAKVDGATAWQRFLHITLPLVKPALLVAVLFRVLDVLRIFDLPYILTHGANGTASLSVLTVNQLRINVNSAQALSTLTFLFIFVIAFILVKAFGVNVVRQQARGVR